MKVRDIRSAIEGLDDGAEVVLQMNHVEFIGSFDDVAFHLDDIGKCVVERPYLIVSVSAYDPENWDDDDAEDDGSDDD